MQVLYNLFDWPYRPGARLVVVGVANTMDLPERLGGKMQSRLGCERIVFQSYTRQQVYDCTLFPLLESLSCIPSYDLYFHRLPQHVKN